MIKKMEMNKSLSNKMGILKSTMRQMKKQQNMTKLHHEEWCDKSQSFIKSSLPEEPIMKLRMCLDISSYSKHDPPLGCGVMQSWLDGLVDSQQKDIVLKTTTADTGAQCFLLGSDHLPGLGLCVENLLRSEINLSCANSTAAGNLGVFYAKVRGEHHLSAEVVETRAMVYVIEGDIVLVSRSVLEKLGCIPKHFPRVGEFLDYEDKALTGKLFSINPYPTGWYNGEFHPELIPNHPPVIRPLEQKTEGFCLQVTPGH